MSTFPLSAPPTKIVDGTTATQELRGSGSNDRIAGKGGGDTLIGGKGDDIYLVYDGFDRILENPSEGIDTVSTSTGHYRLDANIENLELREGRNSTGIGNDLANRLTGNQGNNVLDGGLGGDRLTGGKGRDLFNVAKGNGSDIITDFHADAGNVVRLAYYSQFSDFADIKAAMTQVGTNVVLGLGGGQTLTFNNTKIATFAASQFEIVKPVSQPLPPTSGAAENWMEGSSAKQTLTGTSSNDQIAGKGGNDALIGGKGDDTYIAYSDRDIITERPGEGIDTVKTAAKKWFELPDNVENLRLDGSADSSGIGNALDNRLTGNDGDNSLYGGKGTDVLTGGKGKDVFNILKGEGSDTIADFHADAGNLVRLSGYSQFGSFAQVKAAMTQKGSDVVLSLGYGETLTFKGTTIGAFSQEDFALGIDLADYHLTFNDEFASFRALDGDADGVWRTRYHNDPGRTLSLKGEQEWYMDPTYHGSYHKPLGVNPFSVEDGILSIEARSASASLQQYIGGYDYTSGVITTEGTFAQTYGYFEMRAALPSGSGMHPAFWMLTAEGTWDVEVGHNLEIDIMEAASKDPSQVYQMGNWFGGIDTAGYHTYGLEWTAETLTWYVDGVQTHAVANWIHEPMYLIASLAVGGTTSGMLSGAIDPVEMKIDYVRAYSLNPTTATSAAPTVTFSALGFAGGVRPADAYDFVLKAPTNMTFSARNDMGLDGLPSYAQVAINGDPMSGTLSAGYTNCWSGNSSVQVIDQDHGSVKLSSFMQAIVHLGGSKSSSVTLTKVQTSEVITGAGNDKIAITAYNGVSGASTKHLISAGDGNDTITVTDADWYGGSRAEIQTGSGDDSIKTSAKAVIDAGWGDDLVIGSAYGDVLTGGKGADSLQGSTGNDTYYVDNAADKVTEFYNGGQDTIRSSASFALSSHVENLILTGTAPITAAGNSQNNELIGNGADNILNGMNGSDVMRGRTGNDVYVVDTKGDHVIEHFNEGRDTVKSSASYALGANLENLTLTGSAAIDGTGNSLSNILIGNAGANKLWGAGGADKLQGEGGSDILIGGSGADVLLGGTGSDLFQFGSVGDVDDDKIADFTKAETAGDVIDLSKIDAIASTDINDRFDLIGSAAFSGTAGELRGVLSGTRTVIQGDIDGDAVADFSLELQNFNKVLAAGDFVL